MENLLDIYHKLKEVFLASSEHLGDLDYQLDCQPKMIDSLSFFICFSIREILGDCLESLENDCFCAKCIYQQLDIRRKAITRYLIIENEEIGKIKTILLAQQNVINEACMFFAKNYDVNNNNVEHIICKNQFYEQICKEIEEDMDKDEEF